MIRILLLLVLIPMFCFAQQTETSHWRPAYHFSPNKNWTNDPNGLIYHEGEWHLFFQHNPYENKWGHMSWGHAVSKDLVTWQELPVAIPEDSVWIFSGTVVVDKNNTAGFGKNAMVAIYTADYHGVKENQHLAYSTDKGRTWRKYAKNPLIPAPLGSFKKGKLPNGQAKDFRDPNVIWHEASKQWIMSVMLPTEFKVQFYGSKNLLDWTFLSEFGEQGDMRKIWECPALLEMPTESGSKWVLMLSSNGPHDGFVGMQYFVGDFDGKTFKNAHSADKKLFLEYGKDFYAAIPFGNTEKKIMLGWMMSWQYPETISTFPWNGQMTIPREIALKKTSEGWRITQKPTENLLNSEHWKSVVWMKDLNAEGAETMTWRNGTASYRIEIEFDLSAGREFGVKLLQKQGLNQETNVGYQVDNEQLYINRINSGKIISQNFASMDAAPLKLDRGRLKLQIFVDKMSVEVFANDGQVAITDLVFPEDGSFDWQIFSNGGKTSVVELNVYEWK